MEANLREGTLGEDAGEKEEVRVSSLLDPYVAKLEEERILTSKDKSYRRHHRPR